MKRTLLNSIGLLALLGTAASAQDRKYIFVTDRPFEANGVQFAAGSHEVMMLSTSTRNFTIGSVDGKNKTLLALHVGDPIESNGPAKLHLRCEGTRTCQVAGFEDPTRGMRFSSGKTSKAADVVNISYSAKSSNNKGTD